MPIKCSFLFFTCLINTLSAIQHPIGFITVEECLQNGAPIAYLFEEESGVKQFVLSLANGVVVGQGGIVTSNGKILTDTETYKKDQQKLLQGDRNIAHEECMFFEGTLAVISSPGQQCYYHWLLQVLPRLKILKDSQIAYDKIYVYANNFKYHWQKETLYTTLDFLQIPHDKLLFIENDLIVQAKELLVPSVPWIPSKAAFWDSELVWYKQFFKNLFVVQTEQTPKRIFISRSKAHYRRISNEEALMEFLKEKGFVSYYLEDLSQYQQASLFNNAEIIIGPHGAGWTNLIFCEPKTIIIEIDHGLKGTEQRSSFKGMTRRMECSYHPFYVDLLEETDCPENILAPINQDMMVNLDDFKKFIQEKEFL